MLCYYRSALAKGSITIRIEEGLRSIYMYIDEGGQDGGRLKEPREEPR